MYCSSRRLPLLTVSGSSGRLPVLGEGVSSVLRYSSATTLKVTPVASLSSRRWAAGSLPSRSISRNLSLSCLTFSRRTSGKVPSESSFSFSWFLPLIGLLFSPYRYRNRHHLLRFGLTIRKTPPPSESL